MDRFVPLPVALPRLRAVRGTTASLHTGMKDVYGVGRIERGRPEWWSDGKVWHVAPGSILVKQPGDVVRHLAHQGATTYTVVVLPTDEVEQARRNGTPLLFPPLAADDERAAPFHRLLDAVCEGADVPRLASALDEAVDALAAVGRPRPDHPRAVRRAITYIRERVAEAVSLDDLARHAELDKFHLCRAFRVHVGLPPHMYMTHLRVARAKELLSDGLRASDIAPLVGFSDQAQLTRHFRRLVGTTPARYARAPSDPLLHGVVRGCLRR